MTLLIVEGPDGSGKTTLIDAIAKSYPHAIVDKHGAYLGEEWIGYHYFNSIYLALNGNMVVMDRSWRAESIYGEAMRDGKNRIANWEYAALEQAANDAGAVTIFCLPPFEVCEKTWRGRLEREYPQKSNQFRAIYDGYVDAAARWRGLIINHDYTTGNDLKIGIKV